RMAGLPKYSRSLAGSAPAWRRTLRCRLEICQPAWPVFMKVQVVRRTMAHSRTLVARDRIVLKRDGCDMTIFRSGFPLLQATIQALATADVSLYALKRFRQAAIAQLVRALDCGSRGPPFEPGWRYHQQTTLIKPSALALEIVPGRQRLELGDEAEPLGRIGRHDRLRRHYVNQSRSVGERPLDRAR